MVARLKTLAFYKPYEVLSQFSDATGRATLRDFIRIPGVYAAGRLDYRSEGLLILSNNGKFIHRVSDPGYDHKKVYLAQVEGIACPQAIQALNDSIILPDLQLYPACAELIDEPDVPARAKPVRDYHPTSWIKITLREGKKHQVRRMTAAVGYPTLRLIRVAIGPVGLAGLMPGDLRSLTEAELDALLRMTHD
jgi:23S rRNA pseudouridine2457 synthase